MTTFVLVHGAWHAGWCWELISPELERLGHRVVAPDLPMEDPEAGSSRYCDTVIDALEESDGDLIAVGHSLGGLTIPLIAERTPVRSLVFLCAMVPIPGKAFLKTIDRAGPQMFSPQWPTLASRQIEHPDGSSEWPEDAAIEVFYETCDPQVAARAARRLRRQHWKALNEPSPLQKWPDVASIYVVCTKDRAINPEWSRRAAKERLGVDAIELDCDHSPMLSRPEELVSILTSI